LNILWAFSEAPDEDGKKSMEAKLDETIEPPSDAAMKARADSQATQVDDPVQIMEKEAVEDDSWMDGSPGGANGTDGKARKRKGGSKKK
jgi:hypothetical protein